MKKELKLSLSLAAMLSAALFFAGCDKKEVKNADNAAATEVVEAKQDIESQLRPTQLQARATSAELNANDPKIWAFLPDVVAEYNGKKVTKDEIIAAIVAQFPDGKLPPQLTPEMLPALAPQIIEEYVIGQLVIDAAAKAGYVASKENVVKYFKDDLAKATPEQLEELKAQLATQNKTIDGYINEAASLPEVQKSVAMQQYFQKEIMDKITISDDAAKKFYAENPDMFKIPADPADRVRASHILITADANGKAEEIAAAKKKIEEILAEIKNDPSKFEELAKKYSACPSGAKGGDLGMFGKGQMVKAFEDAAFALKEGEISGIVQTNYGFHIIRRNPSVRESVMLFDEVKEPLIRNMKNIEAKKALETMITNLKKASNLQVFVKPVMPALPAVPTTAPAAAPAEK